MRLSVPLLLASALLSCQLEVWGIPHGNPDGAIEARATKTATRTSAKAGSSATGKASASGGSKKSSGTARPSSSGKGSSSHSKSAKSSAKSGSASLAVTSKDYYPNEKASKTSASASASHSASAAPKLPASCGKPKARGLFSRANVDIVTSDGQTVRIAIGSRITAGNFGAIYNLNPPCGWVAKQLTQDSPSHDHEVDNLRTIGDLYGITGTGRKSGDWIIMRKAEGKELTNTNAWRTARAKGWESQEFFDMRDQAAALVGVEGWYYFARYGLEHGDLRGHPRNVLFTESGGRLIKANLVDWGAAQHSTEQTNEHDYKNRIAWNFVEGIYNAKNQGQIQRRR